MSVSTHVLDAVAGGPAPGIPVRLEQRDGDGWRALAGGVTDADGRIAQVVASAPVGDYRMTFDVERYLDGAGFYPEVVVVFRVRDADAHHHVPLLLSPYAYSTYRGT